MNLFARFVLKQKLQSKLQLFVISIYIFLNLNFVFVLFDSENLSSIPFII